MNSHTKMRKSKKIKVFLNFILTATSFVGVADVEYLQQQDAIAQSADGEFLSVLQKTTEFATQGDKTMQNTCGNNLIFQP